MKQNIRYKNTLFVDKLVQRIKDLRNEHGHPQEYLIDRLHLAVHSYETGNRIPTLMSILKICEFYNITLAEFFAPMNFPP